MMNFSSLDHTDHPHVLSYWRVVLSSLLSTSALKDIPRHRPAPGGTHHSARLSEQSPGSLSFCGQVGIPEEPSFQDRLGVTSFCSPRGCRARNSLLCRSRDKQAHKFVITLQGLDVIIKSVPVVPKVRTPHQAPGWPSG